MNELTAIIQAEAATTDSIPFRRFMELALYHPEHGYYTSGRARVGRKGDFFTNVSVGPLFGRLMARQLAEFWRLLGEPTEFTIVEQGAHGGDFAADALEGLREFAPECFLATRYRIVEPAVALADLQRERLAAYLPSVEWHDSQATLPHWTGVHFSNELVDAFPVHVVMWNGSEWMERYVEWSGEGFHFIEGALSCPELAAACSRIPTPLGGTITEVNLAAAGWLAETAQRMARGYVLLVDYGWPREEYHSPTRTTGTLSAYANHQRVEDPLSRPGEIDLTAHVNFSELADAARLAGLELVGYTDQHHFMVGLGESHFADGKNASDVRAFQTLMHPQFMGMAFKIIAFAKALPGGPLMGFRYARKSEIG